LICRLDDGERFEKMRVIPLIARGKMQNLWDILYLRGVDMGFLQTDTLEYLKDEPQIKSIRDRIRYIAVMFPEEIHFLARSDINSLEDLAGKKVSINAKGTGSAVTGPVIFRRLRINAQLEYEDSNIAIERMRKGDLAAHIWSLAKPAQPGASQRRRPAPVDDSFQGVLRALPAFKIYQQGLSQSHSTRPGGRDDRRRQCARSVQLAREHRPVQEGGALHASFLLTI
jgi:NMT1-like family